MTTEHQIRQIHGIATSERPCAGKVSADGTASTVMLARGCNLLRPVPLLHEHVGSAIGTVIYYRWLPKGMLYIRARVDDAAAWEQITECKLRGFSSAFIRHDYEIELRQEGIVKLFTRYEIKEISIVNRPLNQDCIFGIFRGGFERRVAGQMTYSEHKSIHDKARALLANKPSRPSRRPAPQKFSPADIERLWQRKNKGV
jgi:hypothetical protein